MSTATSSVILGAVISAVTLAFNAVVQGVGYLIKYWLGHREKTQSKQETKEEQIEKLKEELYFLLEEIWVEQRYIGASVNYLYGLHIPEEKEVRDKKHEDHRVKFQRFWYVFEVKFAKNHLGLRMEFKRACDDTLMKVAETSAFIHDKNKKEQAIAQAYANFEKVKQVAKAIEDAAMQCVLDS
jgi:membrane protein YqaA with SNARE-associated domain